MATYELMVKQCPRAYMKHHACWDLHLANNGPTTTWPRNKSHSCAFSTCGEPNNGLFLPIRRLCPLSEMKLFVLICKPSHLSFLLICRGGPDSQMPMVDPPIFTRGLFSFLVLTCSSPTSNPPVKTRFFAYLSGGVAPKLERGVFLFLSCVRFST